MDVGAKRTYIIYMCTYVCVYNMNVCMHIYRLSKCDAFKAGADQTNAVGLTTTLT